MAEKYDKFIPAYKEIEKVIEESFKETTEPGMTVEELTSENIFWGFAPPYGPIKLEEVELFLEGLHEYFKRLGTTTYESETKKPILGKKRKIIRFKKEKTIILDKDIAEKLKQIKDEFPPSHPPDDKEIINDALDLYLAALRPV